MYNPIKTITSVLIIATFKFVLVLKYANRSRKTQDLFRTILVVIRVRFTVSGALKLMAEKGDLAEIVREILEECNDWNSEANSFLCFCFVC